MRLGPLSEVGIRMRVVDLARACGSVLGRQGTRFAARLTSFGSAPAFAGAGS